MKKALLTMLLGVMISALVTTASFAEFVYVTQYGKKYHHAESRFIQDKDAEKITIEEAEARGLEPSKDYLRYKESMEEEQIDKKSSKKKKATKE